MFHENIFPYKSDSPSLFLQFLFQTLWIYHFVPCLLLLVLKFLNPHVIHLLTLPPRLLSLLDDLLDIVNLLHTLLIIFAHLSYPTRLPLFNPRSLLLIYMFMNLNFISKQHHILLGKRPWKRNFKLLRLITPGILFPFLLTRTLFLANGFTKSNRRLMVPSRDINLVSLLEVTHK